MKSNNLLTKVEFQMLNLQDDSDILFVAGFGPVTRNTQQSSDFYLKTLGLPLKPMDENSDYIVCEQDSLGGVKHFALWPLNQAAQSCFLNEKWPEQLTIPQSWIEFEVYDLGKMTQKLVDEGYLLLVENRVEPWGQTVTRLLSPEGMLVGLTVTPWLRE